MADVSLGPGCWLSAACNVDRSGCAANDTAPRLAASFPAASSPNVGTSQVVELTKLLALLAAILTLLVLAAYIALQLGWTLRRNACDGARGCRWWSLVVTIDDSSLPRSTGSPSGIAQMPKGVSSTSCT